MPIDPTTKEYSDSIGGLYDTLKNTYKKEADYGNSFSAQMRQHLNDAVNANQASTTQMFDADKAALDANAARIGAPVGSYGDRLTLMRDRLASLHGLAQAAANDRMQYMGNVQDQYMNRLADSASATGAMQQAALLSNLAKIKAASAGGGGGGRRGGGGGSSSGSGAATGTSSFTGTVTGNQDLSGTEAFSGLSQAARALVQGYSPQYGGDMNAIMKAIAGDYNTAQEVVDTKFNRPALFREYDAPTQAPLNTAQRSVYQAYPELVNWFNSQVPWMGYVQQNRKNTATTNQKQNYGGFNMPAAAPSSGGYASPYKMIGSRK